MGRVTGGEHAAGDIAELGEGSAEKEESEEDAHRKIIYHLNIYIYHSKRS